MPLPSATRVVERTTESVASGRSTEPRSQYLDAAGDSRSGADCVLPPREVDCTVLTPSGTVVARGRAAPRAPEHLPEAYAVQLTEIEPRGVLEAMVYADQPTILLRYEGAAQALFRIDHITGPAPARAFYCQPA